MDWSSLLRPSNFIAWWKSDHLRRRFLSLLFWRSVLLACMYHCENNTRKRHWITIAVIDRIESFYSTTQACIQISGHRRNRDMNYNMPERRYVTRSSCYLTLLYFSFYIVCTKKGLPLAKTETVGTLNGRNCVRLKDSLSIFVHTILRLNCAPHMYVLRVNSLICTMFCCFQCTCSFFPEFHLWVQFSLAGETIFEGDMRRGREEVFTYAALLCVVLLRENRHKNGCVEETWEEEVRNVHDDWVPTPETSLPS